MNKTATSINGNERKIGVSDRTLAVMLGCGRETAVKIATEAGARARYGRRVINIVSKVEEYLQTLAEQQ